MQVTEDIELPAVEDDGADPDSGTDPVDRAVAGLAVVDRAMATVLRAISEAGPTAGVSAVRLISLAAEATGWDLRYLHRTVQTLTAMPKIWAAFDTGRLSWSQLRGITGAAKRLRVTDRRVLDAHLAGVIEAGVSGEPDRIVEVAGDLACRLDEAGQEADETAQTKNSFVHLRPDLFGGAEVVGYLDDVTAATVAEALHGAADPPVADDTPPPIDADGKPIPAAWQRPTSRSAQLAEGLRRVCLSWLAGHDGHSGDGDTTADVDGTAGRSGGGRGARPAALVVVDIADLGDVDRSGGTADNAPAATARLLWRLAGGRRRLSTARVQTLTCDASRIPILTDGDFPVAVGDAYDPIPAAVRRAAAARDQGCRFPGCDAPQQWTDLHHVVFREHGGATELANLVSLCRHCHTLAHKHGWQLTLGDDAALTVRRGRWRFVSHPRLRPPTSTKPTGEGGGGAHGPDPPGDPPSHPPRDPPGADSAEPQDAALPF